MKPPTKADRQFAERLGIGQVKRWAPVPAVTPDFAAVESPKTWRKFAKGTKPPADSSLSRSAKGGSPE